MTKPLTKEIKGIKYNTQTIQQYIRGLMRDVKHQESVKVDFTLTTEYVILHLYFPERTRLESQQNKVIEDNGVKIKFYSAFYCSVEFQISLKSEKEVNEMNDALNEFFIKSSLHRMLEIDDLITLKRNERYQHLLQSQKLEYSTNEFLIEVFYSSEQRPFEVIYLNNGWMYDTKGNDSLILFPFVNYHMYFDDKNNLLSDFTTNAIHTIIITSFQCDIFDVSQNDIYHSIYGYLNHALVENCCMELKQEIINALHLLFQKFMMNELTRMNAMREKEMKLVETIGECMTEMHEENPIPSNTLENCTLTKELFHDQVVQDLTLSAMTGRIDFE